MPPSYTSFKINSWTLILTLVVVWIQVKCRFRPCTKISWSRTINLTTKKKLRYFKALSWFKQNCIRKKSTICGLFFPVNIYLVQTQVKVWVIFEKSHLGWLYLIIFKIFGSILRHSFSIFLDHFILRINIYYTSRVIIAGYNPLSAKLFDIFQKNSKNLKIIKSFTKIFVGFLGQHIFHQLNFWFNLLQKSNFYLFRKDFKKINFSWNWPYLWSKLKVRFEVLTSMIKCVLYHLTVTWLPYPLFDKTHPQIKPELWCVTVKNSKIAILAFKSYCTQINDW